MTDEPRKDAWTRERITEVLEASIEDRKWLHRHVRYVEAAVALYGVVLIIVTVLITGIPLTSYGGLIGANQDRVEQIQGEREANIERTCDDQNERHDNTIEQLDTYLALATLANPQMSTEQRTQIKQSRDFTVALINALAPHRDCAAVKAQQIPSADKGQP